MLAQQLCDRGPIRIEQGFPSREQRNLRAETLKAWRQPPDGVQVHVGAAVAPIIAGDAARVAALRQIKRRQGQAMQARIYSRIDEGLCRQSILQFDSRSQKVLW